MSYIQTEWQAGRIRHVRKYYTCSYHPKGASRAKPENTTKAAQTRVNERNRELNLWLRIEANFGCGDSHTTLHYVRYQPENLFQAEKDLKEVLRRTRTVCKKQEIPFRWIAVIETYGVRGNLFHHHIVVNREAAETLWDCWEQVMTKQGHTGRCSSARLDHRDSHRELAQYLLKQSRKTMKLWTELGCKRKQRWHASRNLIIPKRRRRVISANQWAKEPRPRKGERLVKNNNGDAWEMGIHDVTGWPWMEYTAIQEFHTERNQP